MQDALTPMDAYREAEARHGEVALCTTQKGIKRVWTPVYEILSGRWVSWDSETGESCIVRPETVEMTIGEPGADVSLVAWEETPFGDGDE